tara:strand:+ start:1358 stop:2566 length:1209 start_codon:yes stop_codon:yes gene_type:complete
MPPLKEPITTLEYYHRFYPYDALVAWLTSQGHALERFEIVIEGEGAGGTTYMKRFISVRTAAELRAEAIRHRNIRAIHFGGIYSGPVCSAIEPAERIFSIDVDLTDYGYLDLKDARGNVSVELCDKAYAVSAFAIAILLHLLRHAFGFTNILIAYSGRRGVHLHVMDPHAIAMSNEARSAVVDYIRQDHNVDTLASSPLRGLVDMYQLMPLAMYAFERSWVEEMNLLDSLEKRTDFVNMLDLTHHTLKNLADDVGEASTSGAAWALIQGRIMGAAELPKWYKERLENAVLTYVWPRIDENVSRASNHLTKAPFCAHKGSRRVAVPIHRASYQLWNANRAPSLDDFGKSAIEAMEKALLAMRSPQADLEDLAKVATSAKRVPVPPPPPRWGKENKRKERANKK